MQTKRRRRAGRTASRAKLPVQFDNPAPPQYIPTLRFRHDRVFSRKRGVRPIGPQWAADDTDGGSGSSAGPQPCLRSASCCVANRASGSACAPNTRWCNGSTEGFGPSSPGSNPGRVAFSPPGGASRIAVRGDDASRNLAPDAVGFGVRTAAIGRRRISGLFAEDGIVNNIRIFAGRSNHGLAEPITAYLGNQLGRAQLESFQDGEISLKVDEDVRGRDTFVVQSTCPPVNQNLVELLIFIDCLRRASASRITAVIPYFGYARQDRKDEGRVPITAKLVANLITVAGASRVLTIDLHAAQIQGFFDIPVDNLSAEPVFSAYFSSLNLGPVTLVSPDIGNAKRARLYADRMGGDLAIIDKRRISGSETVTYDIIGDVNGKTVLMIDDIIATAGTIVQACDLVKRRGAKRIIVAATHGVLCGPAVERLTKAPIDHLALTDTIPLPDETRRRLRSLTVLSVSELLGEAIRRIHRNESVSSLFMK